MTKRSAPAVIRPFLKWAGNKFRIVDRVRRHLPQGRRLIEPFAGSGAVFLNTEFDACLLCDSNADLISLYNTLRVEGGDFIEFCRTLFTPENNSAEAYYRFRDEFNSCVDARWRSALFVYLNRHGYNGLCRYNASGGFNVPFGRYSRPYFPAEEMLLFHHKAAQATFHHEDFSKAFKRARKGDVVYCDPPYVPLSNSANFTSYSAGGFGLDQQSALAELARRSSAQGIPVLISNHNTEFTRQAYEGARIIRFNVQRLISCDGTNRRKAGELLALFAGSDC